MRIEFILSSAATGTHHILQRELLAACHNLTIQRDRRATVEVHPLSVAAPKIIKQIRTARLERGALNQIIRYVRLSQLHVAAAGIHNQLHAGQAHINMRALWVPQLLADLKSNARVSGGEDSVSKGHGLLPGNCGHHAGQVKLLRGKALCPGGEPTGLSVTPIVTHLHLGTDEEDPLVQKRHAAIVDDVAVLHWHAHVDQHILADGGREQLDEDLPRVEKRVRFQEVILATVAAGRGGYKVLVEGNIRKYFQVAVVSIVRLKLMRICFFKELDSNQLVFISFQLCHH